MMPSRDRTLWLAVVTGPIVWFVYLVVGYALAPAEDHIEESVLPVRALTIGAIVVVTAALAYGVSRLLRAPREPDGSDTVLQRTRFLSLAAVGLGLISLAALLASAAGVFAFRPGMQP